MTNEQLYILISQWHNRLQEEIGKLREQLPETMEKHPKPNFEAFRFLHDSDFKVLDGLKDFAKELGELAEVLVPRPNVSRPIITRVTNNNSWKVEDD